MPTSLTARLKKKLIHATREASLVLKIPVALSILGFHTILSSCLCIIAELYYGWLGLFSMILITQSWMVYLILKNWYRQYKITKRVLKGMQISEEEYDKAMNYIVQEAEKQKSKTKKV